jgi:hypothetical protein
MRFLYQTQLTFCRAAQNIERRHWKSARRRGAGQDYESACDEHRSGKQDSVHYFSPLNYLLRKNVTVGRPSHLDRNQCQPI